MKTEIIKRTFEAKKYPKGSEERKSLNLKAETSEYMTSQKYLLRQYYEETYSHTAYTSDMSFRTKREAELVEEEMKKYTQ